jgi:hypothetical protein
VTDPQPSACGHLAHAGGRLCPHLLVEDAEPGQVKVLTGDGAEHVRICDACDADDLAGRPVDLVVACVGCVERAAVADGGESRWRGWAGVRCRPTPVRTRRLGAVTASPGAPGCAPSRVGWFTLHGSAVRRHGPDGAVEVGEFPALPEDPPGEHGRRDRRRLRLHAARDGSAVALVQDHGRYGAVMECAGGEVVLHLDRGGHCAEQTPFPCAFTEHDGATVVVVGTDWNRLDAFALPDGRLLTPRVLTEVHRGRLFHGALRVSPDGTRILDDSWLWHPYGVPTHWELPRWVDGDVWQAEESTRLPHRAYLWDAPMCWIGEEYLVRWGIGDDDDHMLPGAVLVPVGPGGEELAFAGVPRGDFHSDGRLLFVVDGTGTTVWDPFTGERLAELVGFRPVGHDPFADEFLVRAGPARAERVRLVVDDRPVDRPASGRPAGRSRSDRPPVARGSTA